MISWCDKSLFFLCSGVWGRGTPEGFVGDTDWLEAVIGDTAVGEAS